MFRGSSHLSNSKEKILIFASILRCGIDDDCVYDYSSAQSVTKKMKYTVKLKGALLFTQSSVSMKFHFLEI